MGSSRSTGTVLLRSETVLRTVPQYCLSVQGHADPPARRGHDDRCAAGGTGLTRRQAELLDQLEELFLAEGFARFTLDDLALRLHCSKSTLYALAGSKEQLARASSSTSSARRPTPSRRGPVTVADPALRVTAYLTAVARALAPAGAGVPP